MVAILRLLEQFRAFGLNRPKVPIVQPHNIRSFSQVQVIGSLAPLDDPDTGGRECAATDLTCWPSYTLTIWAPERSNRGQMYLSRREANRLRGIRAANESDMPVAEWVDGD